MENHLEALRAIQRGDLETLGALLEDEPRLAGARDAAGTSLVLQALYQRVPGAVELLLARGPELDLHSAAAAGQEDRVAALLAAGESPDRPGADGFGPLHLACYFGCTGVVRLLLAAGADAALPARHPSGVAPLASAVAGAVGSVSSEVVELLLAAGVPRDPRQVRDFTPLHAAARAGRRELVELLLAAGADPTLVDAEGLDAAEHARAGGHPELAARIRAGGTKP